MNELHPFRTPMAYRRLAALFALLLAVVLVFAYVPLMRVHQGWEDEVYWASTCLSILRHRGAVPSVLADYPRPFSPPLLYGPTIFWIATAALKVFGFSMRTWRSFTFAGGVAYLGAMVALFYRLRRSWAVALGAALCCSLSLGLTFALSLPGRPDFWTLAIVVVALTVAADESSAGRAFLAQWVAFGALLGLAASTTPRVWPLLGCMLILLPLRLGRGWPRAVTIAAIAWITTWSMLLLPLHMTIVQFVSSVRSASVGDAIDVSPLMGGRWGFGHAHTQVAYFGALLLVIGIVNVGRWRQVPSFQRWLIAVALLNLVAVLLLTARSLNMTIYWGFMIEIAALCAWTEHALLARMRAAWALGALLITYLVLLRVGNELPVFAQWSERDPRILEDELRTQIPAGSVVYGPSGQYFYPVLSLGADYRHPVDYASKGRASTPGRPNLPSPMHDACHEPAFLVWPIQEPDDPLPPMPYATPEYVTRYVQERPKLSAVERWLSRIPASYGEELSRSFTIYRLKPHSEYCRLLGVAIAR